MKVQLKLTKGKNSMGKVVWRAYSPLDQGEVYCSKDMHEDVEKAIHEAKTRVREALGHSVTRPDPSTLEFELVF